jgi:hypothetical protein
MKTYARLLCVLLALCCIFVLASCKGGGKGDNDTDKTEDTGDMTELKFKASEGLLVYYIYKAAYEFTEEDLIEHNFDIEKSLKDQMYDDQHTWYDILVMRATDTLASLLVWCNAAVADGVELDAADLQSIENALIQHRIIAAAEGRTLDDYLAKEINPYITEAVLQAAYELEHLSQKYSGILEERFVGSITDEMIQEQITQNSSTDTTPTKNICVIVLSSEVYDSPEDAAAEAENILNRLRAEEQMTYEVFEKYAAEYSHGKEIYFENVAKGDMRSEIDGWLYGAEARQVGDMAVISSDYGAYIVYYESDGDPVNVVNAKTALVDKMFEDWFNQMKEKYGTLVSEELIEGLELDF